MCLDQTELLSDINKISDSKFFNFHFVFDFLRAVIFKAIFVI